MAVATTENLWATVLHVETCSGEWRDDCCVNLMECC